MVWSEIAWGIQVWVKYEIGLRMSCILDDMCNTGRVRFLISVLHTPLPKFLVCTHIWGYYFEQSTLTEVSNAWFFRDDMWILTSSKAWNRGEWSGFFVCFSFFAAYRHNLITVITWSGHLTLCKASGQRGGKFQVSSSFAACHVGYELMHDSVLRNTCQTAVAQSEHG